jgi:hypothetical protein
MNGMKFPLLYACEFAFSSNELQNNDFLHLQFLDVLYELLTLLSPYLVLEQ